MTIVTAEAPPLLQICRGMPAAEWIAADREFWSVNPAARCP